MKKLFSILFATLLVVSLTACAGLTTGTAVTCPSCGHEFTYQADGA